MSPEVFPLRLILAATAAMLMMGGCAVDSGGSRARQQAAVEPAAPTSRTYALGTELTPEGAVAERAAGDSFRRGGEIYLSVNVSSASVDQRVDVEWLEPGGAPVQRAARQVPQSAQFASFHSGPTARWTPGEHRVVVRIDGRKVTELEFTLM
jgi:hypothetical protein